MGGNVVRFLRDNLQFISSADEVEALAGSVEDTCDVYFVPCFSGLFTPHWDATARGTICGLSNKSSRAHIALAALKAIAFQTVEMVEAVEADLKENTSSALLIKELKTDGGMTANQLFNQLQSDALGRSTSVSGVVY